MAHEQVKNKTAAIREAILAAQDLAFEDMEILGVTVRINELTAIRGQEFNKATKGMDGERRLCALIVFTVTDPESGDPVFTMEDVEPLMEKSEGTILTLAQKAMRLNGMKGGEEEGEAGAENLK